jgi:hypothetical protein
MMMTGLVVLNGENEEMTYYRVYVGHSATLMQFVLQYNSLQATSSFW